MKHIPRAHRELSVAQRFQRQKLKIFKEIIAIGEKEELDLKRDDNVIDYRRRATIVKYNVGNESVHEQWLWQAAIAKCQHKAARRYHIKCIKLLWNQ